MRARSIFKIFFLLLLSFGFASAYYEGIPAFASSPTFATVGDSPIVLLDDETIISTARGAPVVRQPLQASDKQLVIDSLSVYDENVHVIPPSAQSILGDERILLHVKRNNGDTVLIGLDTDNGVITNGAVLGVVDSDNARIADQNAEYIVSNSRFSYTVGAYVDESTIEKIISSDDPQQAAVSQLGKGITFKGLNLVSAIKFFFINIVMSIVSSFYPTGFSVSAGQEFCPAVTPNIPLKCFVGEMEIGSPYGLSSDYAGICGEMDSSGPQGYWGYTYCRFSWTFCVEPETKFDEKRCMCPCTAKVKDPSASVSISQSLPSWNPASHNASSAQASAWNSFLSSLYAHENQHAKICQDDKDTVKAAITGLTATAEDRDCTEACKKAEQSLRSSVDTAARGAVATIQAKNDAYDSSTDHGRSEGATLDCSIK